ncbi:ATP-dependent exodnase (exonuclease V) alpha subunit - helicase superfamily I member [Pedobacter ginsengisoli]|uniref:ATP-dependent exodnase (Exonuclease V) alpha subunit-helicase superfamily I member n=1 Tax=Pedobacter ginsengisoli TaxID=363852 RepID=A0A2D1U911_9SPHI|nr:DUF3108 domain-containing protein [Pedobacter ginsengisoli]ATP58070.1 ATP-dependent exodnase (exonuclease V) alpha subunit - helicase superfamily I member [Pedobacter ginsengisoli]
MRKSLLFIVVAFLSAKAMAQELPFVKEPVFQPGEVLSYKLKYGFITAAEGTLKVLNSDLKFDGNPTYRLSVDGVTSGTFDIFYKIRDHYDSYIDKTNLKPYFFQENIREGSYRRQDKARFSQDEKKVVATKGTFPTPNSQTFDLVSSYYFARSLDISKMKSGDYVKLNYFLSDEINQLEIQYLGKEVIKTKLGKISCLKFSPSIKPGRIFRKDSKLYLWITDDGNRVPVKAEVEILVGSVVMEIKSAEGLKYPLQIIK